MTFPNFGGKHAEEAFFSPADVHAYRERSGGLRIEPLDALVVCYQPFMVPYIRDRAEPIPQGFGRNAFVVERDGARVAAVVSGIGAPAAAALLENAIAAGVRRVANIGTAGTLQAHADIGDVLVCDAAIRDEGVSHHYLPTEKYSHPHAAMTARLEAALDAAGRPWHTGTSWTIDAPYRETVGELRHYQAEGVLCVEMEAAAVFAVAAYRGVEACAAFVVSDSLADLEWNPQFASEQTSDGLRRLFDAAVVACALP